MERGISHGWGTSAANRELVRRMRAYNDGRPASERLRFAGFDGPLEITHAASPRQALTALHAYLAAEVDADLLPCTGETLDRLLGTDDRWTDPAAMLDPARSVGRSTEAGRLRLLADDLVALLDADATPARGDLAGRLGPGAPVRAQRQPLCFRGHHRTWSRSHPSGNGTTSGTLLRWICTTGTIGGPLCSGHSGHASSVGHSSGPPTELSRYVGWPARG